MDNPKLQFLILCDNISEENNKVSLNGVFEAIRTNNTPVTLPKFYLVSRWIGGAGEFVQKITIRLKDKQVFSHEQNFSLKDVNHQLTLVGLIENFVFSDEGIYNIEAFLNAEP